MKPNPFRIVFEDASQAEPGFVKASVFEQSTPGSTDETIEAVAFGASYSRAAAFALEKYAALLLLRNPREL